MRYVFLLLLLICSCVRSEREECLYDLDENDVTKNFPVDIASACTEYVFFVSQEFNQRESFRQFMDLVLLQCLSYKYREAECKKRSDLYPQFRLKRRERKKSILPGEEL